MPCEHLLLDSQAPALSPLSNAAASSGAGHLQPARMSIAVAPEVWEIIKHFPNIHHTKANYCKQGHSCYSLSMGAKLLIAGSGEKYGCIVYLSLHPMCL